MFRRYLCDHRNIFCLLVKCDFCQGVKPVFDFNITNRLHCRSLGRGLNMHPIKKRMQRTETGGVIILDLNAILIHN